MSFDAAAYGTEVQNLLLLDQGGERLMPLAKGRCSSAEARRILLGHQAKRWLSGALSPEGARSGLLLYFSCLDESHSVSQELSTQEGSFWHGIMHRQEPDPGNAAYWFRQTGEHPVFPQIAEAAAAIWQRHPACGISAGCNWDPFGFVDIVEKARRQPGSELELAVMEVQRAEWQILFDYCARKAQ